MFDASKPAAWLDLDSPGYPAGIRPQALGGSPVSCNFMWVFRGNSMNLALCALAKWVKIQTCHFDIYVLSGHLVNQAWLAEKPVHSPFLKMTLPSTKRILRQAMFDHPRVAPISNAGIICGYSDAYKHHYDHYIQILYIYIYIYKPRNYGDIQCIPPLFAGSRLVYKLIQLSHISHSHLNIHKFQGSASQEP